MIHHFLFMVLLNFCALYGSETVDLNNEDLICYNTLKDAFLAERSESFKTLFNESFPEPTEEAIEILGYLLPDIEPWQETNPPSTNVIIGTKRITIYGTVGLIIYETRPNAEELAFFQWLLKEIEERGLTSGDEVLELIGTFLWGNDN